MIRSAIFLAIMIPGICAAIVNRFWALLLYLWFALFRPQEWVWVDVSQLRLSLVLGVLLVVPSLLTGILPNLTHPLSVGSLVFLASSLASQWTAMRPDIGWLWIDGFFRLVLVSLLLVSLTTTKRRYVAVVAIIAGSFGFHSAKAGVVSIVGGGVRLGEGFAGAFMDNNGYALGTVMILPLLIATAQTTENKWMRRGFWTAVPLSILTVVATFSRAGFLALIAATMVFLLLQRRKFVWFGLAGLAALLALLVVPIPQKYFDRINTIRTYEEVQDVSALSRLHFWRVALDMARDRPLGVGLRNYEVAYDQYDDLDGMYGTGRSVHSSHFEVIAELGFGGFAVYLSVFIYAFWAVFRVRRRARAEALSEEDRRFYFSHANALIASMVGFLVGGGFIALALNDLTWLTFSLIAAIDRLPAMQPATTSEPKPVVAGTIAASFQPRSQPAAFTSARSRT